MLLINRETLPALFIEVLARALKAAPDGGVPTTELDATEAYTAGLLYAFSLTDLVVGEDVSRVAITQDGGKLLDKLLEGESLFDQKLTVRKQSKFLRGVHA